MVQAHQGPQRARGRLMATIIAIAGMAFILGASIGQQGYWVASRGLDSAAVVLQQAPHLSSAGGLSMALDAASGEQPHQGRGALENSEIQNDGSRLAAEDTDDASAAAAESGQEGQAASAEHEGSGPALAGRIPKILHHIFIPADNGGENARLTMWPHHERWVQNCKYHYSEKAGWEYRLWNASACEALVAEHYPFFLDFYKNNITLANEKSDMMRYIVLHHYGGLYLDSDVDCWREASDMLEGYDVVLQGTHGAEGAGSAAIASIPGAPLWMAALEMVPSRQVTAEHWTKSIQRTGPDLLTDAAVHEGLTREEGVFKHDVYHANGLVYRVHPAGTWFLPCQWWQKACRRKIYQDLAIGQQDFTSVVGMHRFAGSWIEGKEDGKGIVNVTDELCNPTPDPYRRRMLRGMSAPVV